MNKLSALSLSLLALSACADPFDPGSLVREPRVVGARVVLDGDTERATPHPEETARVEFLTVGPMQSPVLRWQLVACIAGPAGELCQGSPLQSSAGEGVQPSLTLLVPSAQALGASHTIRVGGVVCSRGEPELHERGGRCVGADAAGTPLMFDMAVSRAPDDSDENRHPSLAQTRVQLDASDWLDQTAASDECQGLLQVAADEEDHDITFEVGPEARQLTMTKDKGARFEQLQLSHFVTAGELSRQFSFVEADDARERPSVKVVWTAPSSADLEASSQRVRLTLVVRDGRGGIARLERSLCVVR